MTEYIIPTNIDDRILSKASKLLTNGGVAALPTDTSWSVVCSLKSREGIKKLRKLSGERDERHFTLLCSDISQFGEFCSLDNTRFRLIKRLTPGPYVFVLNTLLGTEKALGLRRRELGVRLPDHPVPVSLIKSLECPLYSITAKKDMEEDSDYEEENLFEGGWELESIAGLDLILDPGEDRSRIFSTILDMKEGEVKLIRQGAGAWPV
ncbi:MAG: L-threonylcarbamoyladenylate synthase [Treponema sp.]|jgi:tRNA threonylcarbamoyl adenosine modification protein (Sua5/YciO/YrdC/YwlC family)|nr:L-threonylcarbamoyladenylate synthase [Treponema sp.]